MDNTSAENLLNQIKTELERSGISEYVQESRWIIEDVLGNEYTRVRAGLADAPTASQLERTRRILKRRTSGEPLAHILGEAWFCGRKFVVAPGVLIPRPETEILVEQALKILDSRPWHEPELLDLYTGCGNVILSIVAENRHAGGIGVDFDTTALECAVQNRGHLGIATVRLIRADVNDFISDLPQKYHIITANPPYVSDGDTINLDPNVALYENPKALYGGPDGLDHFRLLAQNTRDRLNPGGCLIAEFGIDQGSVINEIFISNGWSKIEFVPDLRGIPRILTAKP